MTISFEQRPSESILYRQSVTNDTITNAVWSITPTASATKQEQTDTDTTAMVSGLNKNTQYSLTCRVTCASGQVFEKSAIIRCV